MRMAENQEINLQTTEASLKSAKLAIEVEWPTEDVNVSMRGRQVQVTTLRTRAQVDITADMKSQDCKERASRKGSHFALLRGGAAPLHPCGRASTSRNLRQGAQQYQRDIRFMPNLRVPSRRCNNYSNKVVHVNAPTGANPGGSNHSPILASLEYQARLTRSILTFSSFQKLEYPEYPGLALRGFVGSTGPSSGR